MQGVDRFDQLLLLFSMAKTHSFKKYYVKLEMGLLDFALTNAEIHFFMANPHFKKRRNHRFEFRNQLCQAMYIYRWLEEPLDADNSIFADCGEVVNLKKKLTFTQSWFLMK